MPDSGTGPRPGIFVLNPSRRCAPSAYLFAQAVRFFLLNGHAPVSHIRDAGIILVNSCCVTEDKIGTSLAALEVARDCGRGKTVVLLGCLAALPDAPFDPEGLVCVGPRDLDLLDARFPHRVSVRAAASVRLPPEFLLPGQHLGPGDAFLLIGQGCVNACSYCNIRRVKGCVGSASAESILARAGRGLEQGLREFALLADDCASWGRDIGTDLVELVRALLALEGGLTLKLCYVFPSFVEARFEELAPLFATGRIVYANIPLQSGSQRILDLMNRRYRVDRVVEGVRRLRALAPDALLCTHVLVNFPTETEEDFRSSLALADVFSDTYFLHYSDNRGTAAARLEPKVPAEEALRRLDIAADFVNARGRGVVIRDFDCNLPYNISRDRGS
jgi:tRNA A37 methylthiotransferase MiaB